MRKLEIGSGKKPLRGFEHLDIVARPNIDHVCDASGPLPFEDGTFAYVYACHVLEHIAWFHTRDVIKEWVRILAPGGTLDISVPDAAKACRGLLAAEEGRYVHDGWNFRNPAGDPYLWASGVLFYGGKRDYPQDLHRALFTPKYLRKLFEEAGLKDVSVDPKSPIKYAAINLRMKGVKTQ